MTHDEYPKVAACLIHDASCLRADMGDGNTVHFQQEDEAALRDLLNKRHKEREVKRWAASKGTSGAWHVHRASEPFYVDVAYFGNYHPSPRAAAEAEAARLNAKEGLT